MPKVIREPIKKESPNIPTEHITSSLKMDGPHVSGEGPTKVRFYKPGFKHSVEAADPKVIHKVMELLKSKEYNINQKPTILAEKLRGVHPDVSKIIQDLAKHYNTMEKLNSLATQGKI